MLIPFGVFSAGAGGATSTGSFDLLATTILSSSGTNINFNSIPDGYKHLQLRIVARSDRSANGDEIGIAFNYDTASNYRRHQLTANGSSVTSFADSGTVTSVFPAAISGATGTSSAYGAVIIDFLDYANTSKYKTVRSFNGTNPETQVGLRSALWMNTAAIYSIYIFLTSGSNYSAGTRFSLYGIRG